MNAKMLLCSVGLASSFALASCGRSENTDIHPQTIETPYGNKFVSFGETAEWSSNAGTTLNINFQSSPDDDADALRKSENMIFGEYEGLRATMLGFRRVSVTPIDPNNRGGLNFFGIHLFLSVDAGPGPLPGPETLYVESPDGTWVHGDTTGPSMDYVESYSLKSGEKFGLEYAVEDFPSGTFIYDCLSCAGDLAPRQMFSHIYEMINQIVLPAANRDNLNSLTVFVFLGPRKTEWQFPKSISLQLAKHADGQWWGPIATADTFVTLFNKQLNEYQELGHRMRGEKAAK
jgi:hypothetical protein